MSYSIGFDVFAKDRASDTFDKLGKKVGDTGSKFDAFKGKAVLAAGIAGAALVTFGKNALSSASDQNEVISKSSVIFGKNAGAIDKWASGASRSMGLSKTAALTAASGFGDMFLQLGFAGDAGAEMSKKVVQMSADLGSFNNLPTADVTERMSAAFRGEYDSLQTLIPNINAARVEQEAMAATGKKTTAQLTAQEKAAAVLAIVTKDGARAQGDFARTADGLANKQKIATAQFDDMQAVLGQKLLPIGQKVVGWLSDAMTWMQANTGTVKVLVGAVGFLVVGIGGLMILQKVTAVVALFNAMLLANPIGLVVVAVAALAAGLIYAYNNSETFRTIVTTAFSMVKEGALTLALYAVKAFHFLLGAWLTVAGGIINGAAAAFGWVPGLGPKLQTAASNFNGFKDKVNGSLSKIETDLEVTIATDRAKRQADAMAKYYRDRNWTATAAVNVNMVYGGSGRPVPRAGGGRVTKSQMYAVGDNPDGSWNKTTELFVPDGDGYIANSKDSARLLGGGGGTPMGAAASGGGDYFGTVQFVLDGKVVQESLLRLKRGTGGMELGLA